MPHWMQTGVCIHGNHFSPLVWVVSNGTLRLPSESGERGTKSKDTSDDRWAGCVVVLQWAHTGEGSTASLCKPRPLDVTAQLCLQSDGPVASKLYDLVPRLCVCTECDVRKCCGQVTSLSPLFSRSVTDVWRAAGLDWGLSFTCKCRTHVYPPPIIDFLLLGLFFVFASKRFSKLKEWPETELLSILCLNASCADKGGALI